MRKLFGWFVVCTFAAFMVGCGGGEQETETTGEETAAKKEKRAAATGYQATTVTDGGTIAGMVTFTGAIPPKQKLEVTKDVQVCGQKTHYKKDLVVSEENKGLANVVVKITNISQGKSMDSLGESFELDQNGCEFLPHITLVPAGAELAILNSDGILHNIHTYSEKNSPINMAQPGFRKRMVQTFSEPEVIRVACDVHNWMGAYIVVTGHPYYAKTDDSGNYQLTDVPAGTYTLEFWQQTLGTKTAEVTVTAGGTAEVNMEFAPGTTAAQAGATR